MKRADLNRGVVYAYTSRRYDPLNGVTAVTVVSPEPIQYDKYNSPRERTVKDWDGNDVALPARCVPDPSGRDVLIRYADGALDFCALRQIASTMADHDTARAAAVAARADSEAASRARNREMYERAVAAEARVIEMLGVDAAERIMPLGSRATLFGDSSVNPGRHLYDSTGLRAVVEAAYRAGAASPQAEEGLSHG